MFHFPKHGITKPKVIGKRRRNKPTNCTPENLSRGAEVNGSMRRLGVHALAEESHVLHLLPYQSSGHANLLTPHHHHFLPVQQFLRYRRRQSPQHVMPRIHHHHLRTYPRSGHHFAPSLSLSLRFFELYVSGRWLGFSDGCCYQGELV